MKRNKVSATTAVKDKRAGKPVKTREVASTPAAEKGGQPTVMDVDVNVDVDIDVEGNDDREDDRDD